MHYFYILYSKSLDKFYCGQSHEASGRLKKHNGHVYPNAFTKAASDWEIALSKEIDSKDSALYLERFVKKMKSRQFIKKIIADPNILNDILKKR